MHTKKYYNATNRYDFCHSLSCAGMFPGTADGLAGTDIAWSRHPAGSGLLLLGLRGPDSTGQETWVPGPNLGQSTYKHGMGNLF